MTVISEAPVVGRSISNTPSHRGWSRPPGPRPSERPTIVAGDRQVVALRQRRVLATGGLVERRFVDGVDLVSARDLDERPWWIPAAAVWSDADGAERPEHPWPAGLSQAETSRSRAVLSGLSGRLAREALLARDLGHELPAVDLPAPSPHATVLDGRIGHDVPTVVVVRDDSVLGGAGATFEAAYRRALYGRDDVVDADCELATIVALLRCTDLAIGVVDLGSGVLRAAGIHRVSVQLLPASHDPVRRWDADPVD